MKALVFCSALVFTSLSYAQSQPDNQSGKVEKAKKKKGKSAVGEIGGGVGTTAAGVGKGAGSAAEGVGKGAVDLATLHPIDAGAAVGTGAVKAGKDVTVGSVKGVGKVGKGVGHALKKIL